MTSGESRNGREPGTLLRVILHRVALEVNLSTLRKKALTTLTATILEDTATGLGGHACTETMLTLADSLGWLESSFHNFERLEGLKESERGRGPHLFGEGRAD